MAYTSITDIAAANSAIAELYGQTDALMRRVSSLTLTALGGAPLASPVFNGTPHFPYTGFAIDYYPGHTNGWTVRLNKTDFRLSFVPDTGGAAFEIADNGQGLFYGGYALPLYALPVGTIITTNGGFNPNSSTIGGAWAQVFNTTDRICLGSQRIHSGLSGTGNVAKTRLLMAYNYNLIEGPSPSMSIPAGYHTEVILSAQAWSQQAASIYLYLGLGATHKTNAGGSYSDYIYRVGIRTPSIRASDLVWDTVYGSSGVCLYYEVIGATANWEFWDATITWYYVSDETRHQWKRTG